MPGRIVGITFEMSDRVMVFAPAPQLTVTVEEVNEAPDVHLHPGGQGVWQARMINSLGVPVTMCSSLGGETGTVLRPLIEAEGIDLRLVTGRSRNGVYVHDRRDGKRRVIAETPGDPLTRHDLDELYGLALTEGLHSELSLLSGPAAPSVVDADVYRRLAGDLTRNGVPVMADLSGDYLTAVLEGGVSSPESSSAATSAPSVPRRPRRRGPGPRIVKVSHEELVRDGRSADESDASLVRAVRELHGQGAETVVVSRADRPALALLDGELMEVALPQLEPADSRGAGDSMTAGVAAVLARGGDLKTAVRTGAAAGALNVTRHGLGTGRVDMIERLIDRVDLRRLEEGER